jgi:hypothetical protein
MLFKILLVILLVYLLGKLIIKGVVSYLFGNTRDLNDRLRRQQEETARAKKKKEGHITINYQPKPKSFGKNEGDYVDFEAIK